MKKITNLFCVLLLCLLGVATANAKVEQVHATFENPSNTNTTWTPDASGVTKGTFTWSTTYYNQLRSIGLPTGDITKYKKLVVDTEIKSGEQFRILIYKGGSNLTLYASNGVNEFILADTLKVLYPDTYNEFLLACDEICLSGNNAAAPGEAIIKDVYLETYNDEGEQVFATFEAPTNTNTTWTPDATGQTAGTFTWSTTYYNQLRNIGLPSGDISGYKKLVVDTEIKSGNQFRILIYKGGSNLTLYASNGVNEFILADTLKALYPDTYNEFLLACDEICLSGNNQAAPGEAIIKSVYLETYPENEKVDIPDIVYEEDPGKPAGDFVDFTEAFPNLQPRIGIGADTHPIVLGNGDVVVGQRSKNVIADLSAFSKLTMVTSPNLKLVLYMNHEIDAKQNASEYAEEDAGKYVFMDVQADENGLIEVDLTQFDKQDLNCICLPWDNSNKGTVWYILLTEATNVEGIIPNGTYYVMSANEGTLINAEGALDAKGAPITFTFSNNAYTIEGADFFAGKQWTIADAIEGMTGYYTISTAEGFLAASATNTLEQIADGTADAAVWILLQKAYWEDIVNSTYTVAGTKNLTGTENDWEIAEANQMVLNDETGLFEKKFKKIAIDGGNQPEFKVVQTNMEGVNTWYPASDGEGDHNWVITTNYVGGEGLYDITITFDPSDFKEIGVIAEKRIVFPADAIVYDFEAAADAGENPANKNGSANNGQAFYGWENPEKTDSKRQDYKGYEWAEGSVLPEECHVWRRSDRINGNIGDGGLKCPNNREMAIDGLNPGDKVIIVYDAENATDKEIIWAIGDGTTDGGPGVVRATATINGVEAVTGETTIASGAEIVVNSVTPADNGTGYIVFQVKKGMIIQQIAVIPAPEIEPVAPLYVIGTANGWDRTNMEELTFDQTAGTYKYEINTESDFYFAFATYQQTADEATADPNWETFNNNYRYAIAEGDQTATLDTEYQLQKVNGTIKLAAGQYNVYVTKDFKMTIKNALTDGINTVTTTADNAVIYNMKGQRVMNAQKGLYIINGKKVVLK